MIRPAELLATGLPADADAVQVEIDAQYRTLARSRAATAEEYRAVGRCCVENEHWRAVYESIAPGLAAYQLAAIEAYAATRLRRAGTGPPPRECGGGPAGSGNSPVPPTKGPQLSRNAHLCPATLPPARCCRSS
ncbi:TipAS antibiotic-recognition domain-containing protein [Embleya sp. NBC_00888]|uniref:TipAS antibiotic-recognition domain-containing protein n=1 Tax=Embleya sp. NBC_00888 TaxID=2975960 RepID=UPI0038701126|nr:TipAS antibiotic-recognition domain-containing protein [Embleya sp. NBC_00888]